MSHITRQVRSYSRRQKSCIALLPVILFPLVMAQAAEKCKLQQIADVPISVDGRRPIIEAQINGRTVRLLLDSGSFWSSLTSATAQQNQLLLDYSRTIGLDARGVGGHIEFALTTVRTFTLFGVPIRNVDFLVGGSDPGAGAAGLLGQNILRLTDVEYQLAAGKLRLIKPENCQYSQVLAYWMNPGDPYSIMKMEDTEVGQPLTIAKGELNGTKIRVVFDTGASSSYVGIRAAAAAGLTPGDPRLEPAGYTGGLGRKSVQTWIATFPVLKIGDEEIHNARLRIADLDEFDMVLGEDFFLSHRVYVANSQHKIYFTYSGGPVFSLKTQRTTTKESRPSGGIPEIKLQDFLSSSSPLLPADVQPLGRLRQNGAGRQSLPENAEGSAPK